MLSERKHIFYYMEKCMCTYWQMGTCTDLHKNTDKNHTANNVKSECETELGAISTDQKLYSKTHC